MRVGFCVIVLCVVIVAPARAAVIPVTTTNDVVDAADGLCSLREAITSANQNGVPPDCIGGQATLDTVRLGAGTYTLTGAAGDNVNASGDLDVAAPSGPLRLEGAGAAASRISAAGLDRVLDILTVDGVTIAGVTLADGLAQNEEDGGGIRNGVGALALVDAAVTNNVADDGAQSMPGGAGGGIRSGGPLTLTRTTVSGNRAGNGGAGAAGVAGGAGGAGGGVNATGTLTIDRSRIVDNRSGNAGAGGTGDTGGAGGNGGVGAGIRAIGALTMIGTLVAGNQTGAGGNGGTGNVDRGGSGGNGGDGAGLSTNVSPTVRFSTFTGNAAGAGGVAGSSTNGPPPTQGRPGLGTAIANEFLIPANVGRSVMVDSCFGSFVDAGANLASAGGCPGAGTPPKLSAGGVPLAGSPAIDRAPVVACPPTDLTGRRRPQGVRCDSGAFEVAAGALTYSRTSLAFPSVRLGSAATLAVTMGNPGLAGLALPVSIGGAGFRIASRTCAGELAGGRTCAVTVAFAPTAAGRFAGSLRVGGRTLPLSGTGLAAPIAASAPQKKCRVPKLKGKTVKQARRALKKRNCRLGKVTRRGRGRPGRVRASRPKAGSVRAAGTRVRVIVNRARPR